MVFLLFEHSQANPTRINIPAKLTRLYFSILFLSLRVHLDHDCLFAGFQSPDDLHSRARNTEMGGQHLHDFPVGFSLCWGSVHADLIFSCIQFFHSRLSRTRLHSDIQVNFVFDFQPAVPQARVDENLSKIRCALPQHLLSIEGNGFHEE